MKNITRTFAAFGAVVTMIMVTASAATAQTVDPSAGAFSAGVTSVKDNVSGTYAAPLFALVAIAVGIGVGLAWLKRAKSHASS
jgi:uncharacterized membrane protein